ncbi:Queuine tRNA-ribosyltransferase catalytic subunit 1 [Labeo rohita]|uniref:Queuine tRNA-ribosyltransferase catalytic subunit 1 n=1 Tax=Labeo rohita TaxID=84645 RepID=A0ABQ8LVT2_LABRO|nr:Queuine tRNA-ribosyltransferase catalytic subunit 1 [Labeo rohita]
MAFKVFFFFFFFFFFLKEKKSDILFGPNENVVFNFDFGFLNTCNTQCARNLGVLFHSSLKFDKQLSAVVKSCFYQLRLLSKVKHFLSRKNFETAIHDFVTSRLIVICLQSSP